MALALLWYCCRIVFLPAEKSFNYRTASVRLSLSCFFFLCVLFQMLFWVWVFLLFLFFSLPLADLVYSFIFYFARISFVREPRFDLRLRSVPRFGMCAPQLLLLKSACILWRKRKKKKPHCFPFALPDSASTSLQAELVWAVWTSGLLGGSSLPVSIRYCLEENTRPMQAASGCFTAAVFPLGAFS